MRLAITICATERYAYALTAQARRVAAAVDQIPFGHIILVGDGSKPLDRAETLYKELLPNWEINRIKFSKVKDCHQNYQEAAQLTIAQLRTAAFTKARALGVDYCWSLDSDVLPPPNALKCMHAMLEFDDGYYSISSCPYPSQGGGGYLGGRGTIYSQILPNFYEDEVIIPEDLQKDLTETRAKLKEKSSLSSEALAKEEDELNKLRQHLGELEKQLRECPPKGNAFKMNAERWRMRGWLDNAYPAIGKGSVLPSDWCGFGCTLLNRKALLLAHFDGYEGKGTEDLYIGWNRWYPNGLRINVITHCPCDHVIRNPGKPGTFIHQQAYHETEGECVGHLRIRTRPFYSQDEGEVFDPANDGKFVPAEVSRKDAKPQSVAK